LPARGQLLRDGYFPLQELTDKVLTTNVHLFMSSRQTAFDYRVFSDDQFLAEKRFVAENPPAGATISYFQVCGAEAPNRDSRQGGPNGPRAHRRPGWRSTGRNGICIMPLPQTRAPGAGGGRGGAGAADLVAVARPGRSSNRVAHSRAADRRIRSTDHAVVVEPDPLLQTTTDAHAADDDRRP
jgi:hypothetical protein